VYRQTTLSHPRAIRFPSKNGPRLLSIHASFRVQDNLGVAVQARRVLFDLSYWKRRAGTILTESGENQRASVVRFIYRRGRQQLCRYVFGRLIANVSSRLRVDNNCPSSAEKLFRPCAFRVVLHVIRERLIRIPGGGSARIPGRRIRF